MVDKITKKHVHDYKVINIFLKPTFLLKKEEDMCTLIVFFKRETTNNRRFRLTNRPR